MISDVSEVGAAAAPAVLQGRNSVVSINSNYNENSGLPSYQAQRTQPRVGVPGQILSGTGDTGSGGLEYRGAN